MFCIPYASNRGIRLDSAMPFTLLRRLCCPSDTQTHPDGPMKVRSSLKALKTRHRDCKVVRRRGKTYVINKTDPRFKAKQG